MARKNTSAQLAERIEAGADRAIAKPKDLRLFLQKLIEYDPNQLMVVDKEVDPIFEAAAIVDRMRNDSRYPSYPAVLFNNIKGSKIPLLINLHASYERLALSIDSNLKDMVEEYSRRESKPLPPKQVDRSEAPVKEVVLTGADADLSRLPLLKHQELDAGKYITSAVSITRDPKSGVQNAGIFRAQVHGNKELGWMVGTYQSTGYIIWEHRERKQSMHVALAIGHHPALMLSGTTKPPGIGGEFEIAGGLLKEPLEVVRAETSDLLVPARAEIIIEGTVDTDPKSFREEGPFGEYPRYYTGTGPQAVIKIQAITMRRNPIYVDLFNATSEHHAIGGLARMGFLLTRLRDVCPNVTNIHLPLSASARMHAYISMKKHADGEPHLAAFNLFAYNPATKHVFIVDDDIDVANESEVLWALSTRFQADKDLVIIPNSIGGWLNPPTYAYRRDEKGSLETKLIFDCTKPMPPAKFPQATRVPPEVRERMDPGDYVRPVSEKDAAILGSE